jgi:hypothetical protein
MKLLECPADSATTHLAVTAAATAGTQQLCIHCVITAAAQQQQQQQQ